MTFIYITKLVINKWITTLANSETIKNFTVNETLSVRSIEQITKIKHSESNNKKAAKHKV